MDHFTPMEAVPGPEGLLTEREAAERVADRLPEAVRRIVLAERPIEIRAVEDITWLRPEPRPPRRRFWYKAAGPLPDDPALHRYLLAYASDFNLLTTAMLPHGVSLLTPGMKVASVDHAMWFHRPFRFDEWLLYDVESPSASNARGLVRGSFYSRDGQLVATVMQEGLIRRRIRAA